MEPETENTPTRKPKKSTSKKSKEKNEDGTNTPTKSLTPKKDVDSPASTKKPKSKKIETESNFQNLVVIKFF